ncbi:unnamed protein product [Dovyalis caffra]|uniref:RNA polymerase subunit H/Rpb5 C-terminal domain-containing protein n=1 Tax=Dovyalis caffra TaxID=77055 RepID=A0AAV1SRM0_9ROSI|nr:unnamed protein product [Dovyalis caffra]
MRFRLRPMPDGVGGRGFSTVLQITDLLENITKHVLRPKLSMLTAEQKQQLANKYKLEDKKGKCITPGIVQGLSATPIPKNTLF